MVAQGWLKEQNILEWNEINDEIHESRRFPEKGSRDIEEFFLDAGLDHLRDIGILMFKTQELKGENVEPLIQLMIDRRIEKIATADGTWYLTSNGEFSNTDPNVRIIKGRVDQLDDFGLVFLGQNTNINPYYINPH